jgi:hypothetical protein
MTDVKKIYYLRTSAGQVHGPYTYQMIENVFSSAHDFTEWLIFKAENTWEPIQSDFIVKEKTKTKIANGDIRYGQIQNIKVLCRHLKLLFDVKLDFINKKGCILFGLKDKIGIQQIAVGSTLVLNLLSLTEGSSENVHVTVVRKKPVKDVSESPHLGSYEYHLEWEKLPSVFKPFFKKTSSS